MKNMANEELYRNRFENSQDQKEKLWAILCRSFLQKYIPLESVILDAGAGYGEFINQIQAREKYVVDVNTDTKKYLHADVHFVHSSFDEMSFKESTFDCVFVSSVFEHMENKQALVDLLNKFAFILKPNGRLIILQPNIRFVYDQYWDFFDHQIPISDRSLEEVLKITGFDISVMIPQFLPYTFKSKVPKPGWLFALYLQMPLIWRIFGKQCFCVATKKIR